jgi:hypothetical protein
MANEGLVYTRAAEWLYDAIDRVEGDVLLASPFLSFEVCHRLAVAANQSNFNWQLFTCLDASAVANGYLSIEGLKLLTAGRVRVSHVDRLHAKTFIVGNRGFLGSANLTGAGLGSSKAANIELGVDLGSVQVEAVRHSMSSWPSRNVVASELEELLAQARNLTKASTSAADDLSNESAFALVEQLLVDARDETRTLWMKSEYGEPALDRWRRAWWFGNPAKVRPKIKPGDLVFICAQQTHDCYAVVEVTSIPEFLPEDYRAARGEESGRWPWVSRTVPRFVPDRLLGLKARELVASTGGLRNGYIRLEFDEFTAGVRALARLVTD